MNQNQHRDKTLAKFLKRAGSLGSISKLEVFLVAIFFFTEEIKQPVATLKDISFFYETARIPVPSNFGGEVKQLIKAKKIAKKQKGYYLRRVAKEYLHSTFATPVAGAPSLALVNFPNLHREIVLKCKKLFADGSYPEAVEKSFKVVRDRLRELTGHEKGSDAFGKGNLYISGASAPNVDADFQAATKFLLMAIDMFRNEKSHTSDGNIDNPQLALEYLHISSLAMNLLDRASIKS